VVEELKELHSKNKKEIPTDTGLVEGKVSLEHLKEELSYVLDTHKIGYNIKTAVESLSSCLLHHPKQQEMIIDLVAGIKDKNEKILALAACNPANVSFIKAYFNRTGGSFSAYANLAAKELIHLPVEKACEIFSNFTLSDLEENGTNRKTLFRSEGPSSLLCREYAKLVWKKELESLQKAIKNEVEQYRGGSLCLTREGVPGSIVETLRSKSSAFDALPSNLQEQFIEEELRIRSGHFSDLVSSILSEKIYTIPMPEKLSALLWVRFARIVEFLKTHPDPEKPHENLEETAMVYLGELLYLRVINPSIVFIDKDNLVLKQLASVVMALSNEKRFERGEKEESYHDLIGDRTPHNNGDLYYLNDVLDQFSERHKKYIKDHMKRPK